MWTDFLICLFLGWLGVHKFKERKIFMGVLYLFTFGLFGIGWAYDSIRYLLWTVKGEKPTTEPQKLQLLPDGTLPIVIDTSVILHQGETCHFSSKGNRVIPKNKVVGYNSGSAGVSLRVAKGVTLRTGSSKGAPIRQDVLESHPGRLIITNQRIIFSAVNGGFDKNISSLSTATPATDGITLQFGSQQYLIEVPGGNRAYQIIRHILQNG